LTSGSECHGSLRVSLSRLPEKILAGQADLELQSPQGEMPEMRQQKGGAAILDCLRHHLEEKLKSLN
jgi:hypothetical protein